MEQKPLVGYQTKTTSRRAHPNLGDKPVTWFCKIDETESTPQKMVGTYSFGESFENSPISYSGNKIDALPWWSNKLTVDEPSGTLTVTKTVKRRNMNEAYKDRNTCDGWQLHDIHVTKFPPGSIGTPTMGTEAPKVPSQDEHFIRKVAETKAVNKLRRGVASLPMIWFERKQTLENASNRIGQLVELAVKRHKSDLAGYRKIRGWKKKRRFAEQMANDHLELIFGWQPLIEDIVNIVHEINEPNFDFVRANGTHTVSKESRKNGVGILPGGGKYSWVQTTVENISYRCALRADVESQLFNGYRKMGFQPVYTAYDAVPLSFVLGWFSNFGSWIGTFDPLYHAKFRTGAVSRRAIRHMKYEAYGMDGEAIITDSSFDRLSTTGSIVQNSYLIQDTRWTLTAEPEREFFLMNQFSFFAAMASLSLVIQKKLRAVNYLFDKSPFRTRSRRR